MDTITILIISLIALVFLVIAKMFRTKNNNIDEKHFRELQEENKKMFKYKIQFESQQQQIDTLKNDHQSTIQLLKSEWSDREKSLVKEKEKYENSFLELKEIISEVEKREAELKKERDLLEESSNKLSSQIIDMQKMFKEQMEESQKHLRTKFENISNEIFEAKTLKMKQDSKETILSLLNPLRQNINEFKEAVNKKHESDNKDRYSLFEELKRLRELNNTLSTDAQNLTSALQGNVKAQGNWGEIQIEKILEFSGLVENRDYTTQGRGMKMEYDIGQKQQPDIIINLPDKKHIIIDAKVTLNSYTRYINSELKDERSTYLKEYISAVKRHIDGLSSKNYEYSEKVYTPEYVLMFMPIEGALSLALENSTEIFEYGWNKGVILVGPTNLLATLKAVSSVWKQERQKQNVIKIAQLGGSIYDKLYGFMVDMEKIKSSLSAAQKNYDSAYSKLTLERGNVINAASKMKKLGAKAKKSFNEELEENASISEVSDDQGINTDEAS